MLLTERYKELLESKKMPEIKHSEKASIALLLENQYKEEERLLVEGTVSSDVAQFTPILMPLARRVQPELIANELIGVQPMTAPTGFIYSLSFKYTGMGANSTDKTSGRISAVKDAQIVEVDVTGTQAEKGNTIKVGTDEAIVIYVEGNTLLIDSKIASYGAELTVDGTAIGTAKATYSNELHFRKILKGYTGSLPTSDAELLGYDMAEVGFEIKQSQIGVESRKFKAEYSVEMYQDLKSVHGLNADEELMAIMAVEVQNELDREIVDKVNSWASPCSDFVIGGSLGSGSNRFEFENMAHLSIKIANEAREIGRLTRRGAGGNILLVSPKVATVLEQIKGYKAIENVGTVDSSALGVSTIGTFNKMKVVMDAFATSEYCTVLYKGADRKDAIGFYAPYIPITFTRVVHPESGQPAIILSCRYGLKENPLNEGQGIYARTFAVNFGESFLN